jgi:hypothetical protein
MSTPRVLLTRVPLIGCWLALTVTTGWSAVGSRSVAVSPGSADSLAVIDSRCPTFSWADLAGSKGYELVVYRLGAEGEEAAPVLRHSFAASVDSWTPSLDLCLERGGRYAWSVRAEGRKERSDWSVPLLFEVVSIPSEVELQVALRVVRRYLATQSDAGADAEQEPDRSVSSVSGGAFEGSPSPAAVGTTQLSVEGGVEAMSFTGDGSTLTDLDPDNLSAAVPVAMGGTEATDAAGARANLGAAALADLVAHAANASAHHARYSDAEGVAAMGAKADSNPLNHDRTTAGDVVAAVAASALVPGAPCNGPGQAPQWTGSEWTCGYIGKPGSTGAANGFELIDDWGEAWDGLQRASATWAAAKAACESDGGRLPTVTELYRNNASFSSGDLSDALAVDPLWTLIQSAALDVRRITVRLSDGAVSEALESVSSHFRCVWPDTVQPAFFGDACYGPPGDECQPRGPWLNIDKLARPALDYAAAVNECNFYKGSVVTFREMEEAIQQGVPNGTGGFHWASDAILSSGAYVSLVRWTGDVDEDWYFTGANGGFGSPSTPLTFRCGGKSSELLGVGPGSPACNGGCFASSARRAPLVADSSDRTAATMTDAAATCRAIGGSLPYLDQFVDLVHAGWPDASNAYLWTTDPFYQSASLGFFGYTTLRFDGTEQGNWTPRTGNVGVGTTDLWPYRCVWPERREASATVCAADENQNWTGSSYGCVAAVDGDDGGNANPGGLEILDGWGFAWDTIERPAADYATATATCEGLGGSLPTASALHRVRDGNPFGTAIGGSTDTSFLWTLAPSAQAGKNVRMRVSDGGTSPLSWGSTTPYRCVWPSSLGDVLGGRACQGPAADPCFQAGDLRIDRYDRPALEEPAASFECRAVGGRLADLEEIQELLHAGAPNGADDWSWLAEGVGFSGASYAVTKWTGAGTTAWNYGSATTVGGASAGTVSSAFRCVFDGSLE